MPISIAGSGTITGISAGGLPDDCITTAEIAANAVTTAKLGSAEASGLCKAWVNFNGTGTVAIRASYNVSSITDNASADYTVNFTTALSDANYSVSGMAEDHSNAEGYANVGLPNAGTRTTTACRVRTWRLNVGNVDCPTVCVAVFR
jgi:hypothetical protein